MDERIEAGAGPALAAHSKDGSAPGQTPASSAAEKRTRQPLSGQGTRMADQAAAFVREQPIFAVAATAAIGILLGLLLGRR